MLALHILTLSLILCCHKHWVCCMIATSDTKIGNHDHTALADDEKCSRLIDGTC